MSSVTFNGRLLGRNKRCFLRTFHTSRNLLTKPPSAPRFQKPGTPPKDSTESIPPVEPANSPRSSAPRPTIEVARPVRIATPQNAAHPRIADTSSKEYKQAERKWISVIVALPILFVTSYYLFDRLALGHVPPPLPGTVQKSTPKASD